jgi:hypothetical protein
MQAFRSDQIDALIMYHRYRFFEEIGWTAILLFFTGYAYLIIVSLETIPFSALLPFALGVLLYALYQLFGSLILIGRIHATGVRTGEAFIGTRVRWFTPWSVLVLITGLVLLLVIGDLLGLVVLFASGILASALSRLMMMHERNLLLVRLKNDNPAKKVKHLSDVVKQ